MTVIQGDSDVIAFGAGTGGSRSVPVGGAAIKVASESIISKVKSLAAIKLNVDESTLVYKEGILFSEGTNLSISLEDIANENNISFVRCPIIKRKFIMADEVFITSSSGGVTQTTKCGPVSEMLMQAYEKKKVEYGTML